MEYEDAGVSGLRPANNNNGIDISPRNSGFWNILFENSVCWKMDDQEAVVSSLQPVDNGNVIDRSSPNSVCIEDTNAYYDNMNLFKLFELRRSPVNTMTYIVHCGILPREKNCPCCGREMKISKRQTWRCDHMRVDKKRRKRKRCRKEMSIRNGTWFARTKLTLNEILEITYMMIYNFSFHQIMEETRINKSTINVKRSFFRQTIEDLVILSSEPVGGKGKIVEIHESKMGERTCNYAHAVNGQWLLGGYERGGGRIFLVPIEDSQSKNLLAVIKKWILPGSRVVSDCLKEFLVLEEEDLEELRLTHDVTFKLIAPDSRYISWRNRDSPTTCNKSRSFLGYLSHYLFTRHCKARKLHLFDTFLKETTKIIFDP